MITFNYYLNLYVMEVNNVFRILKEEIRVKLNTCRLCGKFWIQLLMFITGIPNLKKRVSLNVW